MPLKKSVLFFACVSLLSLFACEPSQNKELILGQWKGAEWLVGDSPAEYDPHQVHFSFTKDGYSSDFGGEKEKGTYYLRDNKLYSTGDADGQIEITVEIAKLTKDSLVFNMNRSGQPETLTLIRE